MHILYEPKGAAREYSQLAANLWLTCTHGCTYCYVPDTLHKSKEEFFCKAPARLNVLDLLEKDCRKLAGDPREVLFCFACDPYQPHDEFIGVTRQALLIMEHYKMKVNVLTKGGMRAVRDFDIIKRNDWRFGTTISSDVPMPEWEPHAASPNNRCDAIFRAHAAGIRTWVSMEPVIDTAAALRVIAKMRRYVEFWHVGKLNHVYDIESLIDWSQFLSDVKRVLGESAYNIKNSLLRFAA